jgi:two-component system, OmpR family, response regulator
VPLDVSPPRPSARQLLIVEDEINIRELVCLHLSAEGYECSPVSNGREALELLRARPFDLVVLDVMLPGANGFAVSRAIRSGHVNREIPILMLTARDEEADKLAGFSSGADDYLTKPFSMLELTARVGALTRRVRGMPVDPLADAPPISAGRLKLDPAKRRLHVRGAHVPVTPHEFRLLYQLASNPGVVFTRERLLAEVWQGEAFVTERSVDTLMRRLRCKIEPDPSDPSILLTVWGEGYKFADA